MLDVSAQAAHLRRRATLEQTTRRLAAAGHLAIEVSSGLAAAAGRPGHPLGVEQVEQAVDDAAGLGIRIESTPWADVRRARVLAGRSLRYADALYVAAAERQQTSLLTADARIARSGAPMTCTVVTVPPRT